LGREGLQEDWGAVVSSIENLGRRYRLINRFISLGLDVKLRRLGILMGIESGGRILDAGAADGSLTLEIDRLIPRRHMIVMLDPLESMLRIAGDELRAGDIERIVGVLERCPFRGSSFRSVYMSFALRDVKDLRGSLDSLRDIIEDGGRVIIIDLGKPSRPLWALIIGI